MHPLRMTVFCALSLLLGCAASGERLMSVQPLAGQNAAYREGKAHVSSVQPSSFVTLTLLRASVKSGEAPIFVVTVRNSSQQPFDVRLGDFTLSLAGQSETPLKLSTKQEVIDAQRNSQNFRAVMLALAGGIEAGRANMASKNTSFTGGASTTYQSADGQRAGTSQSTFQGTVSNSAAARQAMNAEADRTAASMEDLRATGAANRADAERLILERETVSPGKFVTFILVAATAANTLSPDAAYALTGQFAGDVHLFQIATQTEK